MTTQLGNTVLITGCNGFIGSHLVHTMKTASRFDVLGLDLVGESVLHEPPDHLIISDISKFNPFNNWGRRGHDICCVVHLAAQSSVYDSIEDPYDDAKNNVLGTIVAADMACFLGVPLIYAASGGTIYGKDGKEPGQDLSDTSPYALSKKMGEDYLRMYHHHRGLRYISLRLANIYGLGGKGVIEEWSKRAVRGIPLTLNGGDQTRDFVYIDDCVGAFISAINVALGDSGLLTAEIDIASGEPTSMRHLYQMFVAEGRATTTMVEEEQPFGEVMHHHMDVDPARVILDWHTTVHLPNGIRRTYADIKETTIA